jgi:sugar phosphate isomerase/epimerase
MISGDFPTRRHVLSLMAMLPVCASPASKGKHIPIGLELYSVRNELKKDETATLQSVAKMGYECVEFYSVYYDWTPEHAKEIRKQLDDLGMKCYSTHNSLQMMSGEGLEKAITLNKIVGSKYIVLSSAGNESSADAWKRVADTLNSANRQMKSDGLHAGYHNHAEEWKPFEGQTPMQILASSTDKSIMLQLDVGTCIEAGADPVAWISSHPGRIRSLHLKDWSPQAGFQVLFGEGVAPWTRILDTAEQKGGVEYYLMEQEGSKYPEMETVDRCLVAYRNLKG